MASTEVAEASAATSTTAPRRRARRPRIPYLLLLPAVAVLLVGLGFPVYWQVANSFREFGLAQQFGQPAPWVGLDNYVRIFTSDALWAVVARSLVFCLVNALLTVILGVLLALLMKAVPTWARLTLQVAMLLAWAMPMVAAVTVSAAEANRVAGSFAFAIETVCDPTAVPAGMATVRRSAPEEPTVALPRVTGVECRITT